MGLIGVLVAMAVLVTATISGVFGMAGGMILMGVYAMALPVASAMVLHGVTQLASNGARAMLFAGHIQWRPFGWYALGAGAVLGLFTLLTVQVDRATLLVLLGATPVVIALVPTPGWLRIESRGAALACGAVATGAQLTAGVSGPLLDSFFVQARLDRFQVIATKAATQSFGHLLKIGYFGLLAGGGSELPVWLYLVAVAAAVVGTRVGKQLLGRLDERQFRSWSGRIVAAIGLVYLVRGLSEWLV